MNIRNTCTNLFCRLTYRCHERTSIQLVSGFSNDSGLKKLNLLLDMCLSTRTNPATAKFKHD